MRRIGLWAVALLLLTAPQAAGRRASAAAPALSTYFAVERSIGDIRAAWARPGAPVDPNAAGWNALFDATLNELRTYGSAATENDRLASLGRLYQISASMGSVPWQPAQQVRESLREWLRPRVRLAWAERRLVDQVHAMPPTADAQAQQNRAQWVNFVANDLGNALKTYDSATTVAQKQAGLQGVVAALGNLKDRNRAAPWSPSLELQGALDDLYSQPNLDISADVATLSPLLNVNLVTTGPVFRKGYWSQVTAGPKSGFGLLPSDDGIAFYNSQRLTTVTPITDFQNQVAANDQGRRAAKLYQFGATTYDSPELTITTVLSTSGLRIYPSYKHAVGANISTTPQDRGKLARAIAGLVGYNQAKITKLAYDNAIGQIHSNVEKEAMEEAWNRTQQEAATRNANMAHYLIGYNRLLFRNALVEGLSLRSRPENALIGGKFEFLNAGGQAGADLPQPPSLYRPDSGISADLHIGSILTNYARGAIRQPAVQQVENLMIVTKNVAPGTPPGQGVTVTRNADYAAYLRAVDQARAANDPKVQALRIKRPTVAPDFGADAQGNLVALVHDFQLDLPAPPQAARGGLAGPPARVYRIVAPDAEFDISLKVGPASPGGPLRLMGRVEGFDPGNRAQVLAINEDESQAQPLTTFTSTFVLGIVRSRLVGQPIDFPLNNLPLQGFAIRSVSPLDPTGWIRINLVRTSNAAPTLASQ